MNEYQEFWAQNNCHKINNWHSSYKARDTGIKKFSWAIPTDEVIAECVKYSPIVEIGAGLGYWAHLIEEARGKVYAYDINLNDEAAWFPVKQGDEDHILMHPGCTLFLCWPPYNASMAFDCLTCYKGDILIYVGEGWGGCTGCDDFAETLNKEWKLVKNISIPQWVGIHDNFYVYQRTKLS